MSGERVGLVLAGGGARGAYEAGALSVLLPVLQARGQRPTVLVGSSVGAINAAHLAASAHLAADDAAASLVAQWRDTTLSKVVRPMLPEQIVLLGARLLGSMLSLPGVHLSSLLDPAPVEHTLRTGTDWTALRANIDSGALHAVAVVATRVHTERTVVFCDTTAELPGHGSHVLDYIATPLTPRHVQSAAAIPLLFPPVRVHAPPRAAGWYLDGGVRLNTPIKPALDLGVDRLVVIATSAIAPNRPTGPPPDDTPDLGDVALNILHGKLSDPLIEDLRTLADVNTFFAHGARNAQRFRRARGKNPYRQVPYLFVGPPEPGMIGRLARQVYDAHYAGLKTVRAPNLALLAQLLGATSRTHHELFSYLFFAPEFIDELIELGAQHARAWLDAPPGPGQPWQLTSLDAFRHPSS